MSAEVRHDAVGLGFLGNLVERTQRHATTTQMPMLERRRPGIFEPRTVAPGNPIESIETAIRPSTTSFAPAPAPSHQPRPTRAAPTATLLPTSQPATISTAPATIAPAQRTPATARVAHIASPQVLPMADTPTTVATASMRRPRGKLASESPTRSSMTMPPARPAPIAAVPAQAARSAQIIRVEQSRLESRTTLVEREIDKHRDAPAQRLTTPPRLTRSDAPGTAVAHPVRSAALLATPAAVAPAPAPVHVSIGRVEIRGLAGASAPATARAAAPTPQLGLDEYLQQRHGNGR